jgi:potassium efflux system protein
MVASRGNLVQAVVIALATVAAAAAVHWILRRLGRRLPRLLARRRGLSSPADLIPLEGRIELVLLIPKILLWVAVAVIVSDQFMTLQRLRAMFAMAVEMSVTAPLFTLNEHAYTAIDVLELPAVLAVLWLLISSVTRFLKSHVLQWTGVDRGVQEAVAMLTRYTLVFLAALVVLQTWGIDARSLTIVASVLGVGIGFGLQHIANNFVSGLLVSLERPIRPGDFVKVGEWTGTVERIGPRNTEVRTLDNVAILVPNSRFLETEVVNWSHGDPVCRLHVPIGVAYGSDIGRVRAALLEAAQGHPDVVADPRPRVEFRGFGDSALHVELLVWTREPRIQARLISDLNYRVEATLRRYGIQIPFPQRDLHLRSPELQRLLHAWSRRSFTEEELASANGEQRLPEPPPLAAGFEEDLGPRAWTDDQIAMVAARMRSAGGVPTADRRHLLTVYKRCFIGREAVDWMTRSLGLTRQEAILAGQILMDRGVFHHVLDEHTFKDGHFFYRFCGDAGRLPDAPLG